MRIDGLITPFRHGLRYDPRRYWNDRYRRNGTLRAAGDQRQSLLTNTLAYEDDWDKLRLYLPNVGSILEIGPGTGYYTERLNGQVTSLEVSDVATARLRGRGFNVIRGDLCTFRPGRRWDLVLMIEVVQHIVTRRTFRQAMRALRQIVGKELLIGALCDTNARRTAFHVHQWTGEDVAADTGFAGKRLCDFRTGGLWRFSR